MFWICLGDGMVAAPGRECLGWWWESFKVEPAGKRKKKNSVRCKSTVAAFRFLLVFRPDASRPLAVVLGGLAAQKWLFATFFELSMRYVLFAFPPRLPQAPAWYKIRGQR